MAQVAGTRRVLVTGAIMVVVDVVVVDDDDDDGSIGVVGVAFIFDCDEEVLLALFDGLLLQGMQRATYLLSPSS